MQFNPDTKALYTDAGELIKVLHCPLRKQWDQLVPQAAGAHRTCTSCERTVLHTTGMTETEIVAAVRADASTCLAVDLQHPKTTILLQDIPVLGSKRTADANDNPR